MSSTGGGGTETSDYSWVFQLVGIVVVAEVASEIVFFDDDIAWVMRFMAMVVALIGGVCLLTIRREDVTGVIGSFVSGPWPWSRRGSGSGVRVQTVAPSSLYDRFANTIGISPLTVLAVCLCLAAFGLCIYSLVTCSSELTALDGVSLLGLGYIVYVGYYGTLEHDRSTACFIVAFTICMLASVKRGVSIQKPNLLGTVTTGIGVMLLLAAAYFQFQRSAPEQAAAADATTRGLNRTSLKKKRDRIVALCLLSACIASVDFFFGCKNRTIIASDPQTRTPLDPDSFLKLVLCILASLMLVTIFAVSVTGEINRAPKVGLSLSRLGAVGKVLGSSPPLTTQSKGWRWVRHRKREEDAIKRAVELRNYAKSKMKNREGFEPNDSMEKQLTQLMNSKFEDALRKDVELRNYYKTITTADFKQDRSMDAKLFELDASIQKSDPKKLAQENLERVVEHGRLPDTNMYETPNLEGLRQGPSQDGTEEY